MMRVFNYKNKKRINMIKPKDESQSCDSDKYPGSRTVCPARCAYELYVSKIKIAEKSADMYMARGKKYATLDDMYRAIYNVTKEKGETFRIKVTSGTGSMQIVVKTSMMVTVKGEHYIYNERESFDFTAIAASLKKSYDGASKNAFAQDIGSMITYLTRYSLRSIFPALMSLDFNDDYDSQDTTSKPIKGVAAASAAVSSTPAQRVLPEKYVRKNDPTVVSRYGENKATILKDDNEPFKHVDDLSSKFRNRFKELEDKKLKSSSYYFAEQLCLLDKELSDELRNIMVPARIKFEGTDEEIYLLIRNESECVLFREKLKYLLSQGNMQ